MPATNTPTARTSNLDAGPRPAWAPPRLLRRPLLLRPLAKRDAPAWHAFVDAHPDGTLFHGLAWQRVVRRVFGHRCRSLMACRGDRVVGVLPLFEIRSFLAGRLLVSVPYATYGGVLAEDDDAAAALFQEAKSLGARIQARSIELRSRKAAFDELDIRRTHATFERRLPADPERVIDLFPRKARAAARRASERYDLRVTFGDEQLPELWRLYARSMRRLASPNYPYRFFESLAQAMPDGHVAQVVRWEGRPVAGLLTLLYRETAMPYFIGLDERVDVYGLSHYLYRQSMRWAVEHGYRIYDFGRTRVDNAGPFAFKKHCGFEPTMLEYQVYVPPGRSAPDLSPASPRWTAARRLWRRLPLPITRPLGGWLARSIPG